MMMRAPSLLLSRIALVASIATLAFPAAADELQLKTQVMLDGFRSDYGFPGATVAYVIADGSGGAIATGLADIEASIPMTPQSRMLAASVGKSFVGALILALESDGLLDRGDLISKHLAGRSWFDRLPNHDKITIGNLLRHTSGLPDHVYMEAFARAMAERVHTDQDTISPEDAISFVLDEPPLFEPGARWFYSDTGYLLLGLIVEKVTNRSYYDLVQERFLKPLNLTQTAPSTARVLPGLAVGYTSEGNPFGIPPRTMDAAGRLLWDPAIEWTGGGLVSTAHNLSVWGHALFRGQALSAPYLDRLLDAVRIAPDASGNLYGAGVTIFTETPHGRVFGHGGWIPGYVTSLRHYADFGVTIAFQINSDAGVEDNSTDLISTLETALADLIIFGAQRLPAESH